MDNNTITAGVLALQGSFLEHRLVLEKMGIHTIEVRKPCQLNLIQGIIIPGGESTTMGKLLNSGEMMAPLRELISRGVPAMGTCAGMILLSGNISGGILDQPSLGLLNIDISRNGYGRQKESFEGDFPITDIGGGSFHGVFIRAPIINKLHNGIRVMATFGGRPVAVRQKNILATSFHPELTADDRIHKYFIEMIKEYMGKND